MNTVALPRHPSRTAAAWNAVAGLAALILGRIVSGTRIGRDRRTLQAVPAYLLADIGLERFEVRTSSGDHEMWIAHRRY